MRNVTQKKCTFATLSFQARIYGPSEKLKLGRLDLKVLVFSFPKSPISIKYVSIWPGKLRSKLAVFLGHFFGIPKYLGHFSSPRKKFFHKMSAMNEAFKQNKPHKKMLLFNGDIQVFSFTLNRLFYRYYRFTTPKKKI